MIGAARVSYKRDDDDRVDRRAEKNKFNYLLNDQWFIPSGHETRGLTQPVFSVVKAASRTNSLTTAAKNNCFETTIAT